MYKVKNAEAGDVLNSELLNRSYQQVNDHKAVVAANYFSPVVGEPEEEGEKQRKKLYPKRNPQMKLIREEIESVNVLVEENQGKKTFHIEGPFLQGDIKNRNGRIYESKILAREVQRYNENYISKNRTMGELGHPEGPTVNLDRCPIKSHH